MKKFLLWGLFLAFTLSACTNNTASEHAKNETESANDASSSDIQTDKVADPSEMTTAEQVTWDGMVAVSAGELNDGDYNIVVDSSSSMFSVENAVLHVADETMTATMTMGGTGYLYVYMDTAEEAASAPENRLIPFEEDDDGAHCFTVPVEALDKGLPCAAFSKRKEQWYDRTLVFRADSLPSDAFREERGISAADLSLADGTYTAEVSLSGGSGRASITSPTEIHVDGGEITAVIEWSSPNYDYMVVNGEKYLPINESGNSVFEIPVSRFDAPLAVSADTTAMSEPHEINYTLTFASDSVQTVSWNDLKQTGRMKLSYAKQFSVDYYEDGYALITIAGNQRYLLLPGTAIPQDLPDDITILHRDPQKVYIASSSCMDFWRALDKLDSVWFTSTKKPDWDLPDVAERMTEGSLEFVGKYNTPDFEYLLAEGCSFAAENTMIYHTPETLEKLKSIGIPVLVEYSSYEESPLGRLEWIRLWGLLTDQKEKADSVFTKQEKRTQKLAADTSSDTALRVAYFSINANGMIRVPKPSSYIPKLIEMAGGVYALNDIGATDGSQNASASMNMQMEDFYAAAQDADIIIYNGTIEGGMASVDDLVAKNALFGKFTAVKNGCVWCQNGDLFQHPTAVAKETASYLGAMHNAENEAKPFLSKLTASRSE